MSFPMRDFNTAPAGRPKKNLRPFILKPTDRMPSGGEFLNTMPTVIKSAHESYLKKHQLPPALAPSYLRRPEVMEQRRAKAISKGWRNPRSLS
jgi:hypothetical protein